MPNNGLFIIVATIIFCSLSVFIALFVILYQRKQLKYKRTTEQLKSDFNQQLLQSQLEIQEYSFNQIGQELHDNIGQLLTSTKMLLGVIEIGIEQNNIENAYATVKTATQTLSKAIQEVRLLSKSLNHDWLYQFDLLENLRLETERINVARNITVQLICEQQQLAIHSEAQLMLFRVVQEALQNAIRHANPKQICMRVLDNNDNFQLNIEDDGVGFDVAATKQDGLGLRNMQHRVQLLGGTVEWKTNAGAGTAVIINIPREKLRV
jgi:signal transduction histidine kinase